MKKLLTSEKKVEIYDIGNGMNLMNILTKNENGQLEEVDTYIGVEKISYSHVGIVKDLAMPGVVFNYRRYVRMIEANLDTYIQIYEDNMKR